MLGENNHQVSEMARLYEKFHDSTRNFMILQEI